MSLETLPPELLTIILKNTKSPLDLHKFISASPACLRAFTSASKLILPVVIRNAIPTPVMRSLDKHLERQASKTQRLDLSSDEDIDIDEYVDRYINCYVFNCVSSSLPSPKYSDIERTRIRRYRLYRLYKRLCHLIGRYSTYLKGLGLDTTRFTPAPHKPTSLQKVFLRRGALTIDPRDGTVSVLRKPLPGSLYHAVLDYDLFVSRLAPRDIEKLVCVELHASLFGQGAIHQGEGITEQEL